MAFKYREEIVGKRFLSVRSQGKLKLSKISEWDWRAGVIRAVTHKDPSNPDISVRISTYLMILFTHYVPLTFITHFMICSLVH